MTGTIKMRINPGMKEITMPKVLESIFNISEKSKDWERYVQVSMEILYLAAQRGEKGLYAADWKDFLAKHPEINQGFYHTCIRKLKNAGLLRKTKGRFYPIKDLATYLAGMATTINAHYMDIGVKVE